MLFALDFCSVLTKVAISCLRPSVFPGQKKFTVVKSNFFVRASLVRCEDNDFVAFMILLLYDTSSNRDIFERILYDIINENYRKHFRTWLRASKWQDGRTPKFEISLVDQCHHYFLNHYQVLSCIDFSWLQDFEDLLENESFFKTPLTSRLNCW